MMYENELKQLITQNSNLMQILRAARRVNLPDWLIGAGILRNLVWDHLHGAEHYGRPIPPFPSVEAAIAGWPETATCTAVRLLADDDLYLVAPYGLDDLFQLILRRNVQGITLAEYRRRLQEKRILEKWPRVTVIEG